jgi:hypothetical protein
MLENQGTETVTDQEAEAMLATIQDNDEGRMVFSPEMLCAMLLRVLDFPAYWDEDGYLMHLQFHRDEVRTLANFMSIGIGTCAIPEAVS